MDDQRTPVRQRVRNLSLAAVAGQSGCATVIIVFGALLIGFWLDVQLGQRGPCIFGMLVLSIPFSLFAMLRIALGAIKRISPPIITEEQHSSSESEEV